MELASDGNPVLYRRGPDGAEFLAIGIEESPKHPFPQVIWRAFDENYGGISLDSPWADFVRNHRYTPSVIVTNERKFTEVLAFTVEDCDHWRNVVESAPLSSSDIPEYLETTFLDESSFREGVETVKASAAAKVVLARRARVSTSGPIPPAELLQKLGANYPTCTLFAISPGESTYPIFVGATPECLVQNRDGQLSTMALAGTTDDRPDRSRDEAEEVLLNSEKDRQEHRFVRDMIVEALSPLCDEINAPESPQILRLATLSHLQTPVSARLKADVGILDAADALHPTPAVCGTPREEARHLIAEHEGFDRGLYAGFFGWMHEDDGVFDVALRSALLDENGATLYAGAGITKDSDVDVEWAETSQKFRPLLDAIGEVCQ